MPSRRAMEYEGNMKNLHVQCFARFATVLIICVAAGSLPVFAQRDTGTVSGQVVDPNEGLIPGARITLLDQRTGVVRTATSNQEGFYIIPLVPAGVYQLTAEASGFRKFQGRDIQLEINQNLTMPVRLQIGEVSESITVAGAVATIDTVSSSVKDVVDTKRIEGIPLNGRNVLQLQQLIPGALYTGSGDQFGNTPAFQVNGATSFSNSYTLDGGEHTDSFFNSAITFPNPDAIQEFSIQTSTYSAEYGRNRGATVNAVTRSGTNDFHGTLFEFVRNNKFDARDFFAAKVPPFKRNQFGATLGGPIQRNKMFFFFAWESTRERGAPSTATFFTPTADMRGGNFSGLKTITDPLTKEPFPGNVIPQSRLSAPALNFLNTYVPAPNLPGNAYTASRVSTFNRDQYVGRYDHELRARDRLFARYMWNKDTSLVNRGSFVDWFQDQSFIRQGITAGETHTFSPALLNSFTFAFNRVAHKIDIIPHFGWQTLGASVPETTPGQSGWGEVHLSGYFDAVNGVPWDVKRNTYNVDDTATWVHGAHTVKAGAQVSRYQTHQLFEFLSAGSMTFTGQYTGDAAADFLLGNIATFRQASPGGDNLLQTLWGFFVVDDFKLNSRFTLNLGLRYEPYFGFTEEDNKGVAFRPGQKSSVWPTAPAGLLFIGDQGVNSRFFPADWNNFAPRVGFAWDVFGDQRIAVRGGYGIFYDAIAGIRLNRFPYNQPFMLDLTLLDVPLNDPYRGNPPFPYVPGTTAQQRESFNFIIPSNVTSMNENLVTPYTQQWNFTIETRLPANLTLSTGYVGSKSSKLYGSRNINGAVYAPGATSANVQQRRLYPEFALIEDSHTNGYSQFHSFQMVLKRRYSRGLVTDIAYTLSKNTGYTGSQGEGSSGTRDPFNWRLDNGILGNDVTHVISGSVVYDIPSPFQAKAARYVLGGWQAASIVQIQSGMPFTVRSGANNSFNGQNADTADLVGDPYLTSGSRGEKVARWFNTAAFRTNAVGTVGNVGINTMRGPGLATVDFGMYKNIPIREQKTLQFRAELFNIFNNANFGNPNSTANNSNFGRILSTTTTPRVVEFSLKFRF
ncbi:MAG TPA: carboxypeptidase regulatory-like domain-containing protein [Bryobacteraceae bacterium]|nr:carboxypeptidase regulatory-like domain-containing protein [Bryobacteraceae bacterium]